MLNKVMLIGYLGNDPELRFTGNGKPVANFRMATNNSYIGSDGQKVDQTEWHNIVCWGKLGETVNQYLQKGRQVYVEGRIQTDIVGEGEDRKYYTKVIASRVLFLGGNGNSQSVEAQETEEEIPF